MNASVATSSWRRPLKPDAKNAARGKPYVESVELARPPRFGKYKCRCLVTPAPSAEIVHDAVDLKQNEAQEGKSRQREYAAFYDNSLGVKHVTCPPFSHRDFSRGAQKAKLQKCGLAEFQIKIVQPHQRKAASARVSSDSRNLLWEGPNPRTNPRRMIPGQYWHGASGE
jgi:hypothetical protein